MRISILAACLAALLAACTNQGSSSSDSQVSDRRASQPMSMPMPSGGGGY